MDTKLKLFSYFRKYLPLYFIALLAVIFSILLDMYAPIIMQHIVDDVIIAHNMEPLKILLLGTLGIGVGRCIFQYTKEFLCDWSGSKIASEIRINLFKKIQSLSANFFDGINSGELMSRVTNDVDRIWDITAFMGILMAEVIIRTITSMYFMVRINFFLSIIPIIGMGLSAFVAIKMEKKLDSIFGEVSQENSELNNTAAENLAGIRTVKAFAREGFEINKFHKHNQKYYELNIHLSRVFVKYNPIIQIITRTISVAVLLIGGIFVIKDVNGQKMTIGQLMAMISYAGNIVWPMEMLGWLTNGISSAKASIKKLNKIYEQIPQIKDESPLNAAQNDDDSVEISGAQLFPMADINGDVSFENVTYSSNGRDILKNVSFEIKSGQTLGIMGATGSGKTTIINLLKRMYNVSSGSIKIDGIDIKDLPLQTLRKAITCVMQDVFLFSDTIEGNIKLGERKTITNAQVKLALELSHSAEFVNKMEEKEQTVIGERGVGLSGGQKQRITIARALARKTPILVLDDSTSALDTETEHEIQEVLSELKGMTKIIIAHRISAVRNADKIIVLENGSVVESGTHEELINHNGLYKETYDSQY